MIIIVVVNIALLENEPAIYTFYLNLFFVAGALRSHVGSTLLVFEETYIFPY